ncbi:hypothetical protein BU15DRAFT_74942 [Melanogaster broomeanus]|nr:hypothetical protein BU15DRAFT_74942 [Melanogaster broomeanus]
MEPPPQDLLDAVLRLAQTASKTTSYLQSILAFRRSRRTFSTTPSVQGFDPEEYAERLKKLQEIWVADGPMIQCNQRMDAVFDLLNDASGKDRMAEEIKEIQVYKKAVTTALYSDFRESTYKLDPKSHVAPSLINITALTNVLHIVQLALDIISWLDIIDTSDKQEFMFRQRRPDTGEWIFDEEVSGSGKSVLAAAITDKITKKLSDEEEKKDKEKEGTNERPNVEPNPEELSMDVSTQDADAEELLAFFFCDFCDVRTLRTTTILKTLFAQFLQVEEPDLAATSLNL